MNRFGRAGLAGLPSGRLPGADGRLDRLAPRRRAAGFERLGWLCRLRHGGRMSRRMALGEPDGCDARRDAGVHRRSH